MPPEEQNNPTETNTTQPPTEAMLGVNSQTGLNYDFIKAQPDSTKKPKSKKKLVIIIGVILIILLLILSIFARQVENNTQNGDTNSAVSKSVTAFFNKLVSQQYDDAFTHLSPNEQLSVEQFKEKQVPLLNAAYELATCQIIDTTEAESAYETRLNCKTPTQKGGYQTVVAVKTASGKNGVKITEITEMGRVEE